MKFIFENPEKKVPVFGDVQINQFFVDVGGCLCQKTDSFHYSMITNDQGVPYSLCQNMEPNSIIQRILPKVKKIEF